MYTVNNNKHIATNGGKEMDIKNYADILKFAIKMQIDYVEKDMENSFAINDNYYEGIKRGLQMALEKIDASMFLTE